MELEHQIDDSNNDRCAPVVLGNDEAGRVLLLRRANELVQLLGHLQVVQAWHLVFRPVVDSQVLDLAAQALGFSPVLLVLSVLQLNCVELVPDYFGSEVNDVADLVLPNLYHIGSCVVVAEHKEVTYNRRARFARRVVNQVLAEVLAGLAPNVLLLLLCRCNDPGLVNLYDCLVEVFVVAEAPILARE